MAEEEIPDTNAMRDRKIADLEASLAAERDERKRDREEFEAFRARVDPPEEDEDGEEEEDPKGDDDLFRLDVL